MVCTKNKIPKKTYIIIIICLILINLFCGILCAIFLQLSYSRQTICGDDQRFSFMSYCNDGIVPDFFPKHIVCFDVRTRECLDVTAKVLSFQIIGIVFLSIFVICFLSFCIFMFWCDGAKNL